MVKLNIKARGLDNNDDLWDMGLSELIEETPSGMENRKTRFRATENNKGESNVVLMRPRPSWKAE